MRIWNQKWILCQMLLILWKIMRWKHILAEWMHYTKNMQIQPNKLKDWPVTALSQILLHANHWDHVLEKTGTRYLIKDCVKKNPPIGGFLL